MNYKCSCCAKVVGEAEWDGLYTACHACAFEHSLGHFPCDHGAERESEWAVPPVPDHIVIAELRAELARLRAVLAAFKRDCDCSREYELGQVIAAYFESLFGPATNGGEK